jgi:hypothetical protein
MILSLASNRKIVADGHLIGDPLRVITLPGRPGYVYLSSLADNGIIAGTFGLRRRSKPFVAFPGEASPSILDCTAAGIPLNKIDRVLAFDTGLLEIEVVLDRAGNTALYELTPLSEVPVSGSFSRVQ